MRQKHSTQKKKKPLPTSSDFFSADPEYLLNLNSSDSSNVINNVAKLNGIPIINHYNSPTDHLDLPPMYYSSCSSSSSCHFRDKDANRFHTCSQNCPSLSSDGPIGFHRRFKSRLSHEAVCSLTSMSKNAEPVNVQSHYAQKLSLCESNSSYSSKNSCETSPQTSCTCETFTRHTPFTHQSYQNHILSTKSRSSKSLISALPDANLSFCHGKHRKNCQRVNKNQPSDFYITPCSCCESYPVSSPSMNDSLNLNMLCGFENLGNTCYMSSALQCLIATRVRWVIKSQKQTSRFQILSNFFYYELYQNDIQPENSLGSGGSLSYAFADLVKSYREASPFSSLNPSDLRDVVARINPMFGSYEQHDAQEFLSFFLDGIHEDLNKASKKKKKKKSNDLKEDPTINRKYLREKRYEHLAEAHWQKHLLRNQSFLVDLFLGQLESRVTCLKCEDFSLRFEPFMYLSLPMKSLSKAFSIRSLEDAFAAFCSPERLKDAHWKCPNCKKIVPVEKRITIIKLPPILIIHLKRFEFNGNVSRKIEQYIHVVIRGLNLRQYVRQKDLYVYDLYAVIDHLGGPSSGHYTASCLCKNEWYRFNDVDVYQIDSNKVITQATYVLFFVRRDTPIEPHLLHRYTTT